MPKTRLSLSDRIYRFLLHLFPFDFQREYGGDMASVFRDQRKHAKNPLSLWRSTIAGVIRTAPAEHLDVLRQDLRYAIRSLLRKPGFTIVVLLTLAIGIGANTALYSLARAGWATPLPVGHPEELVRLDWLSGPKFMARNISGSIFTEPDSGLRSSASISYPAFTTLREQSRTANIFAFAARGPFNVVHENESDIASAQYVSGNYFEALGVPAIRGRVIVQDDETVVSDPAAVISYRYWERRFALDPAVIGAKVIINSVPAIIVGVSAPDFQGAYGFANESIDISVPFSFDSHIRGSGPKLSDPGNWWVRAMGRAKPGVSPQQVRAELDAVFLRSARQGWTGPESVESRDVPKLRVRDGSLGLRELSEDIASAVVLSLSVTFGVVLLIVCLNIANLLLARARFRQGEMAVRLAVGAGRSRLVRQLMTEGLVVALVGGAGAVFVAYWGKDVFKMMIPSNTQVVFNLVIDWRVLGFNLALSLAAGLVFGIVPAFGAIRNGARSAGRATWRSTKVLVTAQVAMSVVLLIFAGLFLRTLNNLQKVDVGFDSRNLVMFTVIPSTLPYDQDRLARLYEDVNHALDGVPGVISSTRSSYPLVNRSGSTTNIYGPGTGLGSEALSVRRLRIHAGFFSTIGAPIVAGRDLTQFDNKNSPRVAIVNETLARILSPTSDAVGVRIGMGPDKAEIEVVGVAKDVRVRRVNEAIPPAIYYPDLQEMTADSVTFQIRTAADPTAVVPSIRQALRNVDPNVAMFGIRTQDQLIAEGFLLEDLIATTAEFFSGVVLFLAGLGLYGIMSNGVNCRTREIGIRIALGAQRRQVVQAVIREAFWSVAIGLAVGLAGAFAISRLATSMLYALSPNDPMTFAAVFVVMVLTAGMAALFPVRRASRMDPTSALRVE